MGLPQSNSPVWAEIVSGKKIVAFDFLAAKIFLGSAQLSFKNNPSTLGQLASDLYKLFEKNQNLPTVQKDLEKIK